MKSEKNGYTLNKLEEVSGLKPGNGFYINDEEKEVTIKEVGMLTESWGYERPYAIVKGFIVTGHVFRSLKNS